MSGAAAGARTARVVAQAKVNLLLRVLAREASGYHGIETLFQRLDVGDDVTVRATGAGRHLDCRGADVGPVERNLAYRAALAFVDAAGWPGGFAIEVEKHIPVGGGLGGGSADAGAVLRCLNALAPTPLAPPRLLALAATLGADVPFLTLDAPLALAWGRGERMLVLPPLPARRVTLALSAEGVVTADAYAALAAARGAHVPEPVAWTPADFATWQAVARHAVNDFEPVVFARRPDVARTRESMARVTRRFEPDPREPSSFALMAGSGATVFALLPPGMRSGDPGVLTLGEGARALATATSERVAEVELVG